MESISLINSSTSVNFLDPYSIILNKSIKLSFAFNISFFNILKIAKPILIIVLDP